MRGREPYLETVPDMGTNPEYPLYSVWNSRLAKGIIFHNQVPPSQIGLQDWFSILQERAGDKF